MFCFACTGGIGTGKSYVVRIFSALGIPAYIADDRAKELYKIDRSLLDRLVEVLGDKIVVDGVLQKSVMAGIIFSNKELLMKVNQIVHPRLLEDFYEWRDEQEKRGVDMIVYESAIFLETPTFRSIADKVIVVTAPVDVRIRRVIKRDNIKEKLVKLRINKQWSDEKRLEMADFVIFADGKRTVLPQILRIIDEVKKK
ncbi:MAG: dephospho-CoA kinase [Bacteroidales bacterium]|jgi:dephospho-CoA kinase